MIIIQLTTQHSSLIMKLKLVISACVFIQYFLTCETQQSHYLEIQQPIVMIDNVHDMSTPMQTDAVELLQETLSLLIGKPTREQIKHFKERYNQKYSDYVWNVISFKQKTFNLFAMKSIELKVGQYTYLLYASMK